MIPAVSIQQLKDAWPEFKQQTTKVRRSNPGLPHPLRIRCAILKRFLKLGTEPTELMFAVMAEMPLEDIFVREEKRRLESST